MLLGVIITGVIQLLGSASVVRVHPHPNNVPRAKNCVPAEVNFFPYSKEELRFSWRDSHFPESPSLQSPPQSIAGGCTGTRLLLAGRGSAGEAEGGCETARPPLFLSCLCSEMKTTVCGSPVVITTCCCLQAAHASTQGCVCMAAVPSPASCPWKQNTERSPEWTCL